MIIGLHLTPLTAMKQYQRPEMEVDSKYAAVRNHIHMNFSMTIGMLHRYLEKLRMGCAAGIDGVSAEHIKYAKDPKMNGVICDMLTLCIRFGIVPDSFTKGLLIPLLKKPNIDPTLPQHYRPIVISTTFSKLLEVHILEQCGEHEFHDLQFGFVECRGTNMVVALTHDVVDYCISNGSAVYVCTLDAEGAFDGIPHSILFSKASDVIPDVYWRMLVYWYSRLTVHIKCGIQISGPIIICKGTRQGGLSSPFLFNLLYQDMIDILSQMSCGIMVNEYTYNVCCHADDLLLCSMTITGLQRLIDIANVYITQHGLRFNPTKTKCVTFGKSRFTDRSWHLDGVNLEETDAIVHLGVVLANDTKSHSEARMKATRRAFYSLQSAGLCKGGTNASTISRIFNTAIRPVLYYGQQCIYQNKTTTCEVEKLQCKLLKTALGLKSYCRNSPLLHAMQMPHINQSVEQQELYLYRSMFLSQSRCHKFYRHLLSQHLSNKCTSQRNLVSRILNTCTKYGISLVQFLCDDKYAGCQKKKWKIYPEDGLADSIAFNVSNLSQNRSLICDLLSPF